MPNNSIDMTLRWWWLASIRNARQSNSGMVWKPSQNFLRQVVHLPTGGGVERGVFKEQYPALVPLIGHPG